mgnify:FL=1
MDDKVAEKLFGKVSPQSHSSDRGLTSEDLNQLTIPLDGDEMEIVNVFCMGHHSVFPISLAGRTELTKLAGAQAPADWTGKYFQVSGCPFCSEDMRFQNPVLKDFRM